MSNLKIGDSVRVVDRFTKEVTTEVIKSIILRESKNTKDGKHVTTVAYKNIPLCIFDFVNGKWAYGDALKIKRGPYKPSPKRGAQRIAAALAEIARLEGEISQLKARAAGLAAGVNIKIKMK